MNTNNIQPKFAPANAHGHTSPGVCPLHALSMFSSGSTVVPSAQHQRATPVRNPLADCLHPAFPCSNHSWLASKPLLPFCRLEKRNITPQYFTGKTYRAIPSSLPSPKCSPSVFCRLRLPCDIQLRPIGLQSCSRF